MQCKTYQYKALESSSESPAQELALDIYGQPSETSAGRTLVYVHGGAWRTGDKTDHASTLLQGLTRSKNALPLVSINYRLSKLSPATNQPLVQHPTHEEDVLSALLFLLSSDSPCPTDSITLIGHSCGAFLCCSVAAHPSLQGAVKAIIGIEGIYNLPYLLEEYPDYDVFLRQAFNEDWPALDLKALWNIPILIAHSKEDELLTLKQCRWMFASLGEREVDTVLDVDTLKGGHDDLLDLEAVRWLILEKF